MPYEQGRDAHPPRGHSRTRSGKGSNDLSKSRGESKTPSQKAMLSRALQKANTAVQLDNAQNLEGARLAYSEACELLQQVLQRTTGDDDKRKLEAIRRTYASRIEELDQMGPWDTDGNKALPARPGSSEYQQSFSPDHEGFDQDRLPIGQTSATSHFNDASRRPPSRQQTTVRDDRNGQNGTHEEPRSITPSRQAPPLSSFSRPNGRPQLSINADTKVHLQPPLASIRPLSPSKPPRGAGEALRREPSLATDSGEETNEKLPNVADGSQHSWLDPIDESGSAGSSIHSRESSFAVRTKHLRNMSGTTETEFDNALDAAIEAAYDDGYDVTGPDGLDADEANEEVVKRVLRKVEMARERVRLTQLEAYHSELQRREQAQKSRPLRQDVSEGFYDDNSSDEEERILEEMVRGSRFDQPPVKYRQREPSISRPESRGRSAGGRRPDDPNASIGANGKTTPRKSVSKGFVPSAPPPNESLPELPAHNRSPSAQSVRNRRMSGHNPKQLKIDTRDRRPSAPKTFEELARSQQRIKQASTEQLTQPVAGDASRSATARQSPPQTAHTIPSDSMLLESPPTSKGTLDGDEHPTIVGGSPMAHRLRKNFSSSSLRSMKSRNVSLSNPDEGAEFSPGTPSSNHLGRPGIAIPALPTPLATAFRENSDGSAAGGLHLFEDSFHLPGSPDVSTPTALDAPVPLEPCPNDLMLRPFWLMRCLYQTLVHPRGGYLSTKLFVPKDVWKVKGVKLKNIEDKISCCDLLTAALLKFAKVDTFDADAVLDEMQALEGVLEQVQASLSRKLGSEVGVHGSNVLFKDASNVVDGDGVQGTTRTTSISSKSSSFSWRRLRSKNSAIGLTSTYSNKPSGADGTKEVAILPTLPMTPQPTNRPAKRDVGQAQFLGPNAHYMSSLARLFDAAQAVDQVARQVEDPGLRHADKTQVGLELCTRHAAEFFGFYVCRFVLTDLGLLLDKFIKRGSEWVLA